MDLTPVYFVLNNAFEIAKNWWWVVIPFILWRPFLFLFLQWRIERFVSQQKAVLLEIKLPKEIKKPIRAMEMVLSSIHASIYQPPGNLWEKWIDGQVQLSLGVEMVCIDGQPHFLIRIPIQFRDVLESSIYAQYPEVEIEEVDDYTKYVPQTIPNKEWDLFGCDYKLIKDDHYPIKTYLDFEKEGEKEEQITDPMAALLEGMAKVKKGEQLWIQYILDPIGDADMPKSYSKWRQKGEALRDKIARRPEPKPDSSSKPMVQEAIEILATGPPKKEEKKPEERDIIPPEMKLTPGERDVLYAIEKKMSKPVYQTIIRFIWLGKRDVWFKNNARIAFSFFNQYATNNLNALFPDGRTLTKVKKSLFFPPLNMPFIRERRHYLKARRLFRTYTKRLSPFFPRPGGTYMLNTEEIASLFHFPSGIVAPSSGLPRVETKKKGTSWDLPVE